MTRKKVRLTQRKGDRKRLTQRRNDQRIITQPRRHRPRPKLMTLPAELRLQILQELLRYDPITTSAPNGRTRAGLRWYITGAGPATWRIERHPRSAQILRVCKQLYEEGYRPLYTGTVFNCRRKRNVSDDKLKGSSFCLSSKAIATIRHLSVSADQCIRNIQFNDTKWNLLTNGWHTHLPPTPRFLQDSITAFKSLQSIQIFFWSAPENDVLRFFPWEQETILTQDPYTGKSNYTRVVDTDLGLKEPEVATSEHAPLDEAKKKGLKYTHERIILATADMLINNHPVSRGLKCNLDKIVHGGIHPLPPHPSPEDYGFGVSLRGCNNVPKSVLSGLGGWSFAPHQFEKIMEKLREEDRRVLEEVDEN
ncbi:MAG: hypothetical protein Q9227_007790 [Pyrenula ochraceoflavens]